MTPFVRAVSFILAAALCTLPLAARTRSSMRTDAVASLPPVAFDFVVVNDRPELLGTGVAVPPDAQGDLVPRLTCRLVKFTGSD